MIPLTPFEVFRTPLTLYRYSDGHYVNGRWIDGSMVTMSTAMISGNILNLGLNLNGTITGYVQSFSISQENTMNQLRNGLILFPSIQDVILSDDFLSFTIISSTNSYVKITHANMSGGITRPTTTFSNSPESMVITASIQPTTGEDMQMVPEARRDQKTYKLYTSTYVRTVEQQNPDQIVIFNQRYELMQVLPWQNNSNFIPVNHFKFIAMIIDQLIPIPVPP